MSERDIVARLRTAILSPGGGKSTVTALDMEAADEIVRLQAEVERLREAVHDLLTRPTDGAARVRARATLNHEGDRDGKPTEYVRADLVATARAEARREALEEAATVAAGWETTAADDAYMTCGNGHFWDPGTNYDQARADAGAAIRALMEKDADNV
ncbi:hypothetical protein [Xanthobacter sediminis]